MGYRRLEKDGGSDGTGAAANDDPHPVQIFGEAKPIPDTKLGRYLCGGFFYYVNVYENNKMFGLPFRDWTEMPEWMTEMHKMFARIENEYEGWRAAQG